MPVEWKGGKFGLRLNVLKEEVPFLIRMVARAKMNLKVDIANRSISFRGKEGCLQSNKTVDLIW